MYHAIAVMPKQYDEHGKGPMERKRSAALLSKRRWRIRHIFLFRRPMYSLVQAERFLGIKRQTLVAWFEEGKFEAEKSADEWQITWPQLVHIALEQWPWPTIYRALGKEARTHMPYLLEPVGLHAV